MKAIDITEYLSPMLAELAEPFDSPEYLFEPKFDGVRAYCLAPNFFLSRTGKTLHTRFPDLYVDTKNSCCLDGEIVCLNHGIPDFNKVQIRQAQSDPIRIKYLAKIYPAKFIPFDIISIGSQNLTKLTLRERKEALGNEVKGEITPFIIGKGIDLYNDLVAKGYEGIMAKRLDSQYQFGKRSPCWLKIKRRQVGEFLAVGLTVGEGERKDTFGSIILCLAQRNGELRYVGNVGSGFNARELAFFKAFCMEQKGAMPFKTLPEDTGRVLMWCKPFPIRVEFMERTKDGKLRFPRLC